MGKLQALHFLLRTRIASRLYSKLHYFRCGSLEDIYKKNVKYPWDGVMEVEQTFKIQTLFDRQAKERLNNSMMASLKLKDALADYFREKTGERPSVNTHSPTLSFLLRLEGPKAKEDLSATIWLDLTGEPLSHRGYRPPEAPAPLRENLAAALVLSTDWKPLEEPLIDPMCGSGTILIEAAMIALDLPPSYLKIRRRVEMRRAQFAFENHLWFRNDEMLVKGFEEIVQDEYQHILQQFNYALPFPILGSDRDQRAIDLARASVKASRLNPEHIQIEKRDALEVTLPKEGGPGVILTNPPYGDRLGELDHLKEEYHQYGEYLKNHAQGYRAYLLTANPELRKSISLKTTQKIPFFNGDKECRLLKYVLY